MNSSIRCATLFAAYCGVSGALLAGNGNATPQVFKADGSPAKWSDVPAPLAAQFQGGRDQTPVDSDDVQSIAEAKSHAKAKNNAAVEQAIARSNRAKPATAEWHFESTRKLLEAARQLAREGDPGSATAVAVLALPHLDQAIATAKTAKQKAQAKAQAGFVHVRFTGDMASAIACYRSAAALDPDDPAIRQTLTRLEESDAILRERLKAAQR